MKNLLPISLAFCLTISLKPVMSKEFDECYMLGFSAYTIMLSRQGLYDGLDADLKKFGTTSERRALVREAYSYQRLTHERDREFIKRRFQQKVEQRCRD